MAQVSLESVSKRFADGTVAVDGISLEVLDREFLVLVGPSGCGKSTSLRMIAGLEACTDGTIRIGDRVVNDVAPRDRDVAMVFQNYALYPHMSVYKNLSFGLTLRFGGGVIARGLRKIFQPRRASELVRLESEQLDGGIDGQVRSTARRLGIEKLLDRKPHQLSGGERQRVALGRAIVRNPAAFLFDEPLSNLDAKLRQQMRVELKRLHRELQATMVYVTHDQVEAMTLGDRVAVMNEGKILQVGSPLEIYQRPANLFVARFVGNVPMNLVSGTVAEAEGRCRFYPCSADRVSTFLGTENQPSWSMKLTGSALFQSVPGGATREAILGFRAEHVTVVSGNAVGGVVGKVIAVDYLGDSTLAHVEVDGGDGESETWQVRMGSFSGLQPGDRVKLEIDEDKMMWFDPQSGRNLWKE